MPVKDALELAKKNKVEIVDLKFVDFPGLWQHFSIPATELNAELFEEGLGFDGSSIRGFQSINESDMILLPDADTAMIDPFSEHSTVSFICNVLDAVTREPYTRDPRYVTQKAEKYLKSTAIADTSYWGPEIEFFIFDSVRFDQNQHEGYYHIDSIEGFWNSGNNSVPNLGNKIRYKEGYFPVPPMDQYQDLRSEMVLNLEKCGVKVEVHHHEVATGGQTEIDMRFDTMTKMADKVLTYKYVVKNTARKRGKVVTVMPKPLFQDNGSGMHCHQSLWKSGKNIFYDKKGYGLISDTARFYIGGLIKHAHALCAFIAPTT
ncbi:MAG: type I glutamate--ammonia ligase, partial [Deltaproteobacteria bacterium]